MRHASIEKGNLRVRWSCTGNNQDPIFGIDWFMHDEVSDSIMVSVLFGHWDLGLAAFESGWVSLFGLIWRICMAWSDDFDGWNIVLFIA